MTNRVALPVIGGLAVAYLDRIAAGDTTRASIVLNEVASVWPGMRAMFAAEAAVPSVTYPRTLPAAWDGDTQTILVTAFKFAAQPGTPLHDAIDRLYDTTPAGLAAAARTTLALLPRNAPIRRYVNYASTASVGAMSRGLDAMVSGTIAIGVDDASGPPTPSPTPPPRPTGSSSTPIKLPDTQIVGHGGAATSSPWPWYVLAGVVTVGLGIFAWQRFAGATS